MIFVNRMEYHKKKIKFDQSVHFFLCWLTCWFLPQVKPVHYIMVSIKSPLITSKSVVQALPRGLELELDVTYHDNSGRAFAATRTNLSTRASRGDLIRITPRSKSATGEAVGNASFSLTLLHSGQTVLRLFDPSLTTRSVDFVKLPIEELIFPTKVIVLSTSICDLRIACPGESIF